MENNSEVDAFLLKGKNRENKPHSSKEGKGDFLPEEKVTKARNMYESYQSKQVKRSGSEMKNKHINVKYNVSYTNKQKES